MLKFQKEPTVPGLALPCGPQGHSRRRPPASCHHTHQ